jgi:hypothetical protein
MGRLCSTKMSAMSFKRVKGLVVIDRHRLACDVSTCGNKRKRVMGHEEMVEGCIRQHDAGARGVLRHFGSEITGIMLA